MAFSLRDLLPFGKKNQDYVGDANAAKERQTYEKIRQYSQGLVTIQDVISPEAIEVDFN